MYKEGFPRLLFPMTNFTRKRMHGVICNADVFFGSFPSPGNGAF